MNKQVHKLSERRTITVQCWTWKTSLHVVQLFVGNVEVRRWKFANSGEALAKYSDVNEGLTLNVRATLA